MKCEVKLLIHSQASTVKPLKFANGYVNTTHTLIGLWLLIHTAITVNRFGTWRHHQMETFSASLAICAGNSPVTSEFPIQRPVTRSFDVFFDLRMNQRLSKQSWGCCFETLLRPIWRHYNGARGYQKVSTLHARMWLSCDTGCAHGLSHIRIDSA